MSRRQVGEGGAVSPLQLKLGLAPRWHFEAQTSIISSAGAEESGIGDIGVGLKWRVAERAPLVGDVAVLPSLAVSRDAGGAAADFGLLLISSRSIGPMVVDLNLGYTRNVGNELAAPAHATLWAVSFGGSAGRRGGWVAEVFGYPETTGPAGTKATVALLFGPTLQVREWLMLDVGLIRPVVGPRPLAVFAGLVWNVGRLWGA